MTAAPLLLQVLGYLLAASGILLFVVASIGLVRFPDAYSRMSAVTKAATLGVVLVLLGVLVIDPTWHAAVAVLLAVALQLVTSPVGAFALARSAYHTGSPLAPSSQYDELARDGTANGIADPGDDSVTAPPS